MMDMVNSFAVLSKYDSYFDSIYNEGGIVWGLVLILAGELAVVALYTKGAEKSFRAHGLGDSVNFYKFQAEFMLIYLIAVRFFSRVLDYSSYVNMILLAALPSFVREKYMKVIITCSVIGVTLFWWLWKTIHMGHGETYPYRSIL